MNKPRTLLVDGDIVAYKAATTAETPVDWGDGCCGFGEDGSDSEPCGEYKTTISHLYYQAK